MPLQEYIIGNNIIFNCVISRLYCVTFKFCRSFLLKKKEVLLAEKTLSGTKMNSANNLDTHPMPQVLFHTGSQ